MSNPTISKERPALVLFDVDGTLVNSYVFDTALFVQAVKEVTGMVVSGEWGSYTYVSDGGVLQEEIARQGLSGNADVWEQKVMERFTQLTREHLHFATETLETPGARDFVLYLMGRKDCVVGVATGGWGITARLKLQHIGLGPQIASGQLVLASSSDHHNRLSIMRLAERKAWANWASSNPGTSIPGGSAPIHSANSNSGIQTTAQGGELAQHKIYFGDGIWDQRACADLGYQFIAIGERVDHPVRFPNFLDRKALLKSTLDLNTLPH